MFHIGQRVVCVNDTPAAGFAVVPSDYFGLRKGQVYIVREHSGPSWLDGAPTIRLLEIVRRDGDPGFWVHRFRPVRETDISIFEKMLTKAPEPVT